MSRRFIPVGVINDRRRRRRRGRSRRAPTLAGDGLDLMMGGEVLEGEEHADEASGELLWLEEELGRRLPRKRRRARSRRSTGPRGRLPAGISSASPRPWGPPLRLGKNVVVRARDGHRATIIEMKPGLYIVAELPEEAYQPEFGFLNKIIPKMVEATAKTIERAKEAAERGKRDNPRRLARQEAREARKAKKAGATAPQDELGCGCGCARCRGR